MRAYYQANHCWTAPTFNDLVCWLWVVRNGARCWQQQWVSKPWLQVCCTATSLNLPRIFTLLLWVERGPATAAGDRYSCTTQIHPVLQPNSERFQQGSRTVPIFRGVHFRVTSPRPQRLKPNRFAVGNNLPKSTCSFHN